MCLGEEVLFVLGKFISHLLISPTLFILTVLLCGILLNRYNINRYRKILIVIGVLFYVLSIRPTKEIVVRILEPQKVSSPAEIEKTKAYVLLGGGLIEGTPIGDIPGTFAYSRIVETAILYNKSPKKIFITGGRVYDTKKSSESSVYKGVLVSLGIPEEDIILEEESRTTYENAVYTKKLLKSSDIDSITLVTSATHMFRAKSTFKSLGINVAIAPSGYLTNKSSYKAQDFLPSSSNLNSVLRVFWEYVGIIVYKLKMLKF